ncbi:MAG: SUMF1/EgtB/PvdO family nonheme iron enzyme [Spirochaetota bacterium]|nr:SUMF1/EgtB/PvdO family nonheme iron enzyme [Spirochaetota bacterium]
MTDKKTHKPVYIISDSPKMNSDQFGFNAYSKTIAELIANKDNKTPLVIGIYGPWGSGKTTLMQTTRYRLDPRNEKNKRLEKNNEFKDKKIYRKCRTVWFQAWKYKNEDEILAALIEEIFKTMEQDNFFQLCKAKIQELTDRIKTSKITGDLSKLVAGVNISEFFSEMKYKEKLGFYDIFQEFFDDLLWTYLNWRPKGKESEKPDDTKAALIIFIDDLDRCPEPRILNVLETIKLFMDKKGCVFVIGADNDIIEKALKKTYDSDAVKFMDKIVQVTFNLPKFTNIDFELFLEKLVLANMDDVTPHLPLILPAMQDNPRRLKRFLNNLNLVAGLLRNRNIDDIEFRHVLFWNIIDYRYPRLRDDIRGNPDNLDELKKEIKRVQEALGDDTERWIIPSEIPEKAPSSLQQYINQKVLVDIILKFDIERDKLVQLITMSGVVESAKYNEDKKDTEDQFDFGIMAKIDAATFKYGDDKREKKIDQPYEIDIYSVTNAQYEEFIKAGGYRNDKYWSEEGFNWRNRGNVIQPKYWNDPKWSQADCPVVGVNFYEAEAYAKWAHKRLPTEIEWERAARGTDGREYPWGDEFDRELCNTRESGHGKTTRVTLYPKGRSPAGCYDMAGNVWEWTSSWSDKDKDSYALRGGSWSGGQGDCRCAARLDGVPLDRYIVVGFRCARAQL